MVIRGFGLERSELVALLLRPIRHVMQDTHDKASLESLASVISIYLHISIDLPAVSKMLVRGGLTVVVLHNMASFLSLPALPKPIEDTTLELEFFLIYATAHVMDGNRRWVREALRGGLFTHLEEFLYRPGASEDWAVAARRFFARTIIPACVHPPLIPALSQAAAVITAHRPYPAPREVRVLNAELAKFAFDAGVFQRWRDDFQAAGGFRMECSVAKLSVRTRKVASAFDVAAPVEKRCIVLEHVERPTGETVTVNGAEPTVRLANTNSMRLVNCKPGTENIVWQIAIITETKSASTCSMSR
ncbi:hypothetical protein H0H92_012973 [Tricholoma furcatifolium]|nr:hypothetical protein H0H92_012973 [Tricholoma furcatifolium]